MRTCSHRFVSALSTGARRTSNRDTAGTTFTETCISEVLLHYGFVYDNSPTSDGYQMRYTSEFGGLSR